MPMSASFVDEARWLLQLMMFCCCFLLSSQRIGPGIAVLNMVNWTAVHHQELCLVENHTVLNEEEGEYAWNPSLQAHVHSSYFYGLFLMQLPAELLVQRVSAPKIAFVGMFLSSVCTVLIPGASRFHIAGILSLQVMKAMGHALAAPAFSFMMAQWIPRKKLIAYGAYATCGIPTGAFITLLVGGLLCHYPTYRWPYVFYYSGSAGILWCFFWIYLCFSLHFIPVLSSSRKQSEIFTKINVPVPYVQIFKSWPFWGYVAAGIASYWMLAVNIIVLPTYLRIVFGLQMDWIGLVSSFPNVLQAFTYLYSFVILKKRTTEKTTVRRFVACIGMSIFAACMVLLTFVKCSRPMGILFMVLAVGFSGFTFASLSVVPVSMSPNFSGILSGIMNTLGSASACGLPLMVGYLMDGEGDSQNWNQVFYACAFTVFISMILFMAYSSYEIQSWNGGVHDSQIALIAMPADKVVPVNHGRLIESTSSQEERSTRSKTKSKRRHTVY